MDVFTACLRRNFAQGGLDDEQGRFFMCIEIGSIEWATDKLVFIAFIKKVSSIGAKHKARPSSGYGQRAVS